MRPTLSVLILTATAAVASAQTAPPPARKAPAAPVAAAPAGTPAAKSRPAAAKPALAAKPTPARVGIEALEDRLDRAADGVSAPQLLPMLGRPGSARGYRLPGYGVVVVLAPRALPGPDGPDVFAWRPRHRVHVDTRRPGDVVFGDTEELEAIERQVILLQHESEQARRAAEETQQRIVETVRWRHSSPGDVTVEIATAPPPAPPEPAEAPEAPAAPQGAALPTPPPPPAAPAPPPWKYWFSASGPRDTRAPEAVVADVRAALVDALASHPGPVSGLAPDEFVAVAVDFESAGRLVRRPRPERTLVVRARVRDMEARAAGTIAPDELRRRLEVLEY